MIVSKSVTVFGPEFEPSEKIVSMIRIEVSGYRSIAIPADLFVALAAKSSSMRQFTMALDECLDLYEVQTVNTPSPEERRLLRQRMSLQPLRLRLKASSLPVEELSEH